MKKLTCFVLLIFSVLYSSAQKGIVFETNFNSWNEVLEKAQVLNKPIFVDIYTTWCGPCRLMDQTVFIDSVVGNFFNKNFLSVKLDAEKGYGIDFNKNNNISGYPTYLFFSPLGDLIQVGIGAQKINSFLSLANNVMKDYHSGENLQAMEDIMQKGVYDSAFLVAYIKKLGKVKMVNEKAIERYLSFLPLSSLYSAETYEFIRSNYSGWISHDSKVFEVLDNAYKKYPIKSMELMKPWWVLNGWLLQNVDSAIERKDSFGIKDIIEAFKKMDPDNEIYRMNSQYIYSRYYAGIGDSINFKKNMALYISYNVLSIDHSLQQKNEKDRYHAALKLKYGAEAEKELSTEDLWFTKSYICKYRLTLEQLKSIQFYYSKYLPKNAEYEKIMDEAFHLALHNYKSYSPNFNEYMFRYYSK